MLGVVCVGIVAGDGVMRYEDSLGGKLTVPQRFAEQQKRGEEERRQRESEQAQLTLSECPLVVS